PERCEVFCVIKTIAKFFERPRSANSFTTRAPAGVDKTAHASSMITVFTESSEDSCITRLIKSVIRKNTAEDNLALFPAIFALASGGLNKNIAGNKAKIGRAHV